MRVPSGISRRSVLGNAGRLALGFSALTALAGGNDAAAGSRLPLSGRTMGTIYRISVPSALSAEERSALHSDIEGILERVDARMSTYRPQSELSRFNSSSDPDWHSVSPDLARVAATALEIGRLSRGAFDPTMAPLVDLWGFGPGDPVAVAPDTARIAAARKRTGSYDVAAGPQPTIRKQIPDLSLDLSGIAKGFAVDGIAEHLETSDIGDFLIEIGGDIRVGRSSPDRRPWRIGIERPAPGARTPHRIIALGQGAVATSGNYRNAFEAGGRHYSHIIDPRTGIPVEHDTASVTVIAASSEVADAWSTALMVLGSDAGLPLAERLDLPALFVTRSGRRLRDRPTRAFRRFLIE